MKSIGLAAALTMLALATAAPAKDVVIHAGRLIDGTSAAPKSRVSILIHDDRITAIQPGFMTPANAQVIDLSAETVLPGLIDTHVHILSTFHPGDPIRLAMTRSGYDELIDGVNDARATLMAGFTSARSVGDNTQAVLALKHGIESGAVSGPRLWVAGSALGPSGGHGDPTNGLRVDITEIPHIFDAVIDGPDAARATVRRMRREGVDLIKIMPSGGVMSIGDDPKLQLMADDEIRAVIETAHALGMKVAAHAHGKQAIDHASAMGVDSIEHGTYADAESYRIMKAHGTYLVPTMIVGEKVYEVAKNHPEQLNPSTAEKAIATAPVMMANLKNARAAGVKVAFGTDTFGLAKHGENAKEFALMVGAGFTPMEAIRAATGNAADLIGDTADIGSIQPGRYADIIAVRADPLDDVRALEKVDFVMKGGAIVKRDAAP